MKQRRIWQFGGEHRVPVLVVIAAVMMVTGGFARMKRDSGSVNLVAAPNGAESASQVTIDNFAYSPVPLTVKVGTQVTWVNHDDIPHTVDSSEGKFKSAALDTDDKFEFRFTEAGEYPFYCRIHPKMTGKIIVQP